MFAPKLGLRVINQHVAEDPVQISATMEEQLVVEGLGGMEASGSGQAGRRRRIGLPRPGQGLGVETPQVLQRFVFLAKAGKDVDFGADGGGCVASSGAGLGASSQ